MVDINMTINIDKNLDYIFTDGDNEIFEYVIDIYGQKLLNYCYSILYNYHDAEDIVQEVFIKAFNNKKHFKKGSNFSAWIYRIAYTSSIDFKRKRSFKLIPLNNEIVKEKNIESENISEKTLKIWNKLNKDERALLYGRIIEELSYSELSEIHGISEVSLRKKYQRAKEKFIKIEKKLED